MQSERGWLAREEVERANDGGYYQPRFRGKQYAPYIARLASHGQLAQGLQQQGRVIRVSMLYLVVENHKDWGPFFPSENVITFNDYLALGEKNDGRSVRVINLCPQSRYLSKGYYCSLLAEARAHKVIPSVRTLNDLRSRTLYSLALPDFSKEADKVAQERGMPLAGGALLNVKVYFGESPEPGLQPLARLLRAEERRGG